MATKLRFEFDPRKDAVNSRKHGIHLLTGARIFADPFVKIEVKGDDHGEIRWNAIGEVNRRLIRVTFTSREEEEGEGTVEIIRLISARKATRSEARAYRGNS